MSVEDCKECLVGAVCITPCEKFVFPDNESIYYFLERLIRLTRLKNFHKLKDYSKPYLIGETETIFIDSDGEYSALDSKKYLPRFEIHDKYRKMRGCG